MCVVALTAVPSALRTPTMCAPLVTVESDEGLKASPLKMTKGLSGLRRSIRVANFAAPPTMSFEGSAPGFARPASQLYTS